MMNAHFDPDVDGFDDDFCFDDDAPNDVLFGEEELESGIESQAVLGTYDPDVGTNNAGDGGSLEIAGQNIRESGDWPRTGTEQLGPDGEQRDADARRAEGIERVGHAAAKHSGSDSPRRSNNAELTELIERAVAEMDTGGRDTGLDNDDRAGGRGGKPAPTARNPRLTKYTVSDIVRAPTFQSAELSCTVNKLYANPQGEWMLTLKIPYEDRHAVIDLSDAWGLELHISISRVTRAN